MSKMNAAETALTQCQHIAHDATVELEGGNLVDPMERAKAALERVREVAETGEADPSFVAMLAEADDSPPEAGAMSTSDGLGAAVSGNGEDTVPQGCTGAVMYAPDGTPSLQHDTGTCPIHESDQLAAAKARAQDNYGDDVSPDAVAIFCRGFMEHGATNVELGRAVRKLLL